MTKSQHTVIIETEKTGQIRLTPQEFDMLLMSAMVGLEGHPFEGDQADIADNLFEKVERAAQMHSA